MKFSKEDISLDVVIPIYNEKEVIRLLLEELNKTFSKENCNKYNLKKVTYIFVDDGSTDNSVDILKQYRDTSMHDFIVAILARNFGHQAAITAGLSMSTADIVSVIDADLQDPPHVILPMIEKYRNGFDVVYAKRKKRKEFFIKIWTCWLFYRILNLLSPIKIPLDSGDFCLMNRRVVEQLNNLPEVVRFPRGLRTWVGFTQTEYLYEREGRQAGQSKYSFRDLYSLATDGIASMSLRPLQISQLFGLMFFLLGVAVLLLFITGAINAQNLPFCLFFLLLLNLFGISLTMLTLYIQGAYLGRTYLESKRRPPYIIKEKYLLSADQKR